VGGEKIRTDDLQRPTVEGVTCLLKWGHDQVKGGIHVWRRPKRPIAPGSGVGPALDYSGIYEEVKQDIGASNEGREVDEEMNQTKSSRQKNDRQWSTAKIRHKPMRKNPGSPEFM